MVLSERNTTKRVPFLLKGEHIQNFSICVWNVKSDIREPEKKNAAVKFKRFSLERSLLHSVCIVFENKGGDEFIPALCSYCGCKNCAFFCSHMLCFLFYVRIMKNAQLSQDICENKFCEDLRITQAIPVLIENTIAMDKLMRQQVQAGQGLD